MPFPFLLSMPFIPFLDLPSFRYYEGVEDEDSRFGGDGGYGSEEDNNHKTSFVSAGTLKRKKRSNAGEGFLLVGGNGDDYQMARPVVNMSSKLSTKSKFDILQRRFGLLLAESDLLSLWMKKALSLLP